MENPLEAVGYFSHCHVRAGRQQIDECRPQLAYKCMYLKKDVGSHSQSPFWPFPDYIIKMMEMTVSELKDQKFFFYSGKTLPRWPFSIVSWNVQCIAMLIFLLKVKDNPEMVILYSLLKICRLESALKWKEQKGSANVFHGAEICFFFFVVFFQSQNFRFHDDHMIYPFLSTSNHLTNSYLETGIFGNTKSSFFSIISMICDTCINSTKNVT